MLANVKQATIAHEVKSTITPGSLIFTDEYKISARLIAWDISTHCVCHAQGSMPALEDGDGFCESTSTLWEGFWSLLRSWLRPHPEFLQFSSKLYLLGFEFVHNARKRGKAMLSALLESVFAHAWNPY